MGLDMAETTNRVHELRTQLGNMAAREFFNNATKVMVKLLNTIG